MVVTLRGIGSALALTGVLAVSVQLSAAAQGPPREPGRASAPRSNQVLFERFVGNWDLDVTYHTPEGDRRAVGSWQFFSILEGRAIQDVWKVWNETRNPLGYGTTVRFYDPEIDAWRVTWHGVLNGTVLRFIARQQLGEIVMDLQDADAPTRWIFSDLTPDGFKWRAISSPDGQSWATVQEMVARRRR